MAQHFDSDEDQPQDSGFEIDPELLGDGLSLDDLGAAFVAAAAEQDPEAFASDPSDEIAEGHSEEIHDDDDFEASPLDEEESQADADLVTPEAIVEGALFVGHPENQPLTEERIAKLMRGVSPEEVVEIIDRLNASYKEHGQALRIVRDDFGFKMTVAPEVESVRREFLGKVRETRLSQSAVEVLALVAYQPGVTAQKVQDQRGRESNSLLNQLVRRQLLRMERVKPEGGGRAEPHYYPTERFLYLFGIESLDELPQVEEGLREG
ncbi:SMC-Scp complex subunit ScpB [Rubripirellula amarantea]|uniref:Segregation and condensation protein B n=1 Tax=Rubripirellula amarantea TaxID=2527999 RepID=A0A5C5WFZ3_9BACT|nr:SMC-Scp complex subunit ScpB [Rubripirellula amarantea]MDA8743681.1 SMC-Scp complex subunit ScpB [Rubripirellula amarantea]TWT49786.1 Segregation and condensation protein B [Rubripirellula amarantea]